MPSVEAWQAFGGVLTVVVALGGGAFALQRLGVLRRPAPPPAPSGDPEVCRRLDAVEAAITEIRVELGNRYVRHEDYAQQIARLGMKMDSVGEMVARLDERTKG